MPARAGGDCAPFVDPSLAAPDAPICWLPETGVTLIDAVSSPSVGERFADLTLADVACIPHAIISTDGRELLVVRATDRFVILRLRGCRATTRSVNLTLLVNGLSDPPGSLPCSASSLTSLPLPRDIHCELAGSS